MPGTVRCVGALLLGLGLVVAAGVPPAHAAEPSGTIIKIDPKTRTVTARDERTQQTFQFKVLQNARLRGLKIGQEVFADFKAMKVSLRPDDPPCCNIVTVSSVSTAPAPCCSIAAVDAVAGMATGIEKATGRRFHFKVGDWKTLTGLKIGQPIHANFKTMKVSLWPDGARPCCEIVRR